MSREELKQLWFSIPRGKNKVDIKAIIVTRHGDKHWSCERITDTHGHWASSSANYSTFAEAMNMVKTLQNSEIHKDYELIIK